MVACNTLPVVPTAPLVVPVAVYPAARVPVCSTTTRLTLLGLAPLASAALPAGCCHPTTVAVASSVPPLTKFTVSPGTYCPPVMPPTATHCSYASVTPLPVGFVP